MPIRIQRKRTKGYRSPDNTAYCGRPTAFGNPFSAAEVGHARAVEMFDRWLAGELDDQYPNLIGRKNRLLKRLPELADRDYLSCFCPLSQPCHVDVIIRRLGKERTASLKTATKR